MNVYVQDQVGSSRQIVSVPVGGVQNQFGVELYPPLVYDADFYPYGGEIDFTPGTPTYRFQGKERDSETGNDYFGARFYSSAYGRFLSPDWSSTVEPVPYANLTNPQTLNLYAFVKDNPETFADLDGHCFDPSSCALEFAGIGTLIEPGGGTAVGAVVGGVVGAGILYLAGKAVINSIHNSNDTSNANAPPPAPNSSQQVPTQAPGFVADAGGNVVKIPDGSTVRPSNNNNGNVYQPPVPDGAHPDANAVRVMGPSGAQPTGSITVHGPTGQPINPATGKPDTRANTHTPIVPVDQTHCTAGVNGCDSH